MHLDMQWALYLSDDEIDDSARSTLAANCEDREWIETRVSPRITPSAYENAISYRHLAEVVDPENPPDGDADP